MKKDKVKKLASMMDKKIKKSEAKDMKQDAKMMKTKMKKEKK